MAEASNNASFLETAEEARKLLIIQEKSNARGAITTPPLLLCDEPTSYLDAETGKSVMEHLRKIQVEQKCALIVVTHDPRIFDYADRIEKIEDGQISKLK